MLYVTAHIPAYITSIIYPSHLSNGTSNMNFNSLSNYIISYKRSRYNKRRIHTYYIGSNMENTYEIQSTSIIIITIRDIV